MRTACSEPDQLDSVGESPLRDHALDGGLAGFRNAEDELVFGGEAAAIVQQLLLRILRWKIPTEFCFAVNDLCEVVCLNIRNHVGDRIGGRLDIRETLGCEPSGESLAHSFMLGTLGFPNHTVDKPTDPP